MTTITIDGSQTIAHFLNEVFVPNRLISMSARRDYRTAVARLDSVMGCRVQLRDITSEFLAEYECRLLAAGCAPETVCNHLKKIKPIVRHWRPEQLPRESRPTEKRFRQAVCESSVAEFFEKHFAPRYLSEATSRSVQKYHCVILCAGDYLGRNVLLTDLSDGLITGLSKWLTEKGMAEDRAQVYRQCLRAIAADAQRHGEATGWVSSIDPLAKSLCHGNRRQKFRRDMRGPKAG